MSEFSEEDVAQAQAGDKAAFERLMSAQAVLLADRVRLWINRIEDAEDVLQQIYLRAWIDLPGLRDPAAFRFWLISLARRRCQSFLRTKRKREQAASADELERLSEAHSIKRENADAVKNAVREALSAAPAELREAAEPVYLCGHTIQETAQQLGCAKRRSNGD